MHKFQVVTAVHTQFASADVYNEKDQRIQQNAFC